MSHDVSSWPPFYLRLTPGFIDDEWIIVAIRGIIAIIRGSMCTKIWKTYMCLYFGAKIGAFDAELSGESGNIVQQIRK